MRNNKTIIICLSLAGILTAGVLISRAAGFVTYEGTDKMILWDSARVVGEGLNIGTYGAGAGEIQLSNATNIYIKKFIGFDCPNYPEDPGCSVSFGNVGGNTFLKVNRVSGNLLEINSLKSGITFLNTINLSGNLAIDYTTSSLIVDSDPSLSSLTIDKETVYTPNLHVNQISDIPGDTTMIEITDPETGVIISTTEEPTGLTIPHLKMDQGAIFRAKKPIYFKDLPCCSQVCASKSSNCPDI